MLGATLLLLSARGVPLIDPDEARFARTSLEMVRDDDPVVPRFEGEPRLVKPPLLHWAQAALFATFGADELTARLPSALATLGSALILAWVTRRRFGDEAAVWSAVMFLTSPLVIAVGFLGTIDALLSVHVLAALALDLDERPRTRYRAAAIGAVLGLAFLAKGPVGPGLALIAILAGRTVTRRPVAPSARDALLFLAAWCLVVLPWGVALLLRVGSTSVLHLLRGEVLDRYVAGTAHVEPAWYYGAVLLLALAPWAAPAAIGAVRALSRPFDPAHRTAAGAAAGLLAGVAFLSFGRGKLPSYLLPLVPLAILVAVWELGQTLRQPRRRTLTPAVLAVAPLVFAALLWLAAGRHPKFADQARAAAAIQSTAGAVAGAAALLRRPRGVFAAAAAGSFALLLLLVTALLPPLADERSLRRLVEEVPELSVARPVVRVEMRVPSLTFYLDRVPEQIDSDRLAERLARDDDALFVIHDIDRELIDERSWSSLREIGRHGDYAVYERK